ncbi:hypothetical protein D3C78_1765180 [compost metagenome]
MAKMVPTKAIIPAAIAVSFSSDFRMGETAAIAAAPHTPVPIASRNDNDLSARNSRASRRVIPSANRMTAASRINKAGPC